MTPSDFPAQLAITNAYLDDARDEAAYRLSALREAEQVARDRRAGFERARRVVNRYTKRLQRLIEKGNN